MEFTAYAVVVENSRLIFVASNLPSLVQGRQFQIWMIRKQDPKIVSAGVFSPDGNKRAVVTFENKSLVSDVSSVEVTEEQEGGSSVPTGIKILESSSLRIEPS
jgi:anti-sigma-K factor RskA